MYLEFFDLKEKPFSITPDPRFIFLSKNHKEVFAHLLYGIRNRSGFIAVTGEVGAGKTTVLRTLLDQLEGDDYRLAFIFNPSLTAAELLLAIGRELNLDLSGEEGGTLLDRLNAFLLRENRAGRTVVLVIDEAQNLSAPVLEQVRMLSNLETRSEKLVQIVLVGQPELGEMLERSELRQLSQRITVRYHLEAMDFEDTRDYIDHRLALAGRPDGTLFTPAAVKAIFRHSGGLPRLINVLCDRALLVAFSEDRFRVGRVCVRQARRELQPARKRREGSRTPPARRPGRVLTALALAALAAVLVLYGPPSADAPVPQLPVAEGTPEVTPPPPPPSPTVDPALLRRSLADWSEGRSAALAFSALARRWDPSPFTGDELDGLGKLRAAAAERDLLATPFRGSLETLLNLDVPFMLELSLPGVAGRRYLALTRGGQDGFAISPRLDERDSITPAELAALWTGEAWFLWANEEKLPFLAEPGEEGPEVARLQELMARAGYLDGPVSGRYDNATIQGVARLQRERGVIQDGRVGPQTLLLLYQEGSQTTTMPRLSAESGDRP